MSTAAVAVTPANNLAKEVAKLRAAKKLSLRDVATKAKLTYQSVYRVEKGTGGFRASVAVMKALGIGLEKRSKLLSQYTVMKYT